MNKGRIATAGVLGGVAGALVLAGLVPLGCGNSNNESGSTTSAASSSTSTGSSSSSSSTSSSSSSSSSSSTGGSSSSASSGDAGPDATVNDGGTGEASAPSCTVGTTTSILLSDGGSISVGDGGAWLLFSFDDGIASDAGSWIPNQASWLDGAALPSVAASSEQGHTHCGALALTVPFPAYGPYNTSYTNEEGEAQFNYASATRISGKRIHLWVKIASSAYLGLNGVQPYAQWQAADAAADANPYGENFYEYTSVNFPGTETPYDNPPYVQEAGLADGDWHEIVGDLWVGQSDAGPIVNTGPYVVNLIQLGAQLEAANLAADGGLPWAGAPAEPGTSTLYLDDIWIE
jgi:hypothetical protein